MPATIKGEVLIEVVVAEQLAAAALNHGVHAALQAGAGVLQVLVDGSDLVLAIADHEEGGQIGIEARGVVQVVMERPIKDAGDLCCDLDVEELAAARDHELEGHPMMREQDRDQPQVEAAGDVGADATTPQRGGEIGEVLLELCLRRRRRRIDALGLDLRRLPARQHQHLVAPELADRRQEGRLTRHVAEDQERRDGLDARVRPPRAAAAGQGEEARGHGVLVPEQLVQGEIVGRDLPLEALSVVDEQGEDAADIVQRLCEPGTVETGEQRGHAGRAAAFPGQIEVSAPHRGKTPVGQDALR